MRTTLQIILAVKECEPVTEEELKLALCAMSGIEHFLNQSLKKLIQSIREGKPEARLKMQAEFEWRTIERMFKAIKTPPDEWLGPGNTPGTEENRERMAWAKKVFKKATGEDL
jgi:hypothetical protein